MKVLRYKYSIPEMADFFVNSSSSEWINLEDQNLIVGRNASGKSSLINILSGIAGIITGRTKVVGTREIEFIDSQNRKLTYLIEFQWRPNNVLREELKRDGITLMNRVSGKASLFSEISSSFIDISPPHDSPVVRVRRDEKEFPYFEELVEWAIGVYSFKFGNIHAYDSIEQLGLYRGYNDVYAGALAALENESKKNEILHEFNSLGYNVIDIYTEKLGEEHTLYVKEGELQHRIRQHQLSQGMYRSLALLIYYSFLIEKKKPTLVMIDDLGEGLDFDRSSSLGKILFEKFKRKKVQFVATTNDFFLMNCVDIEMWNIVRRQGKVIKSINYTNSKSKFDDFHFTGLNNFQLFASNFLDEV